MQYGQFSSDVDTTLVTIQQLYPGCGHAVDTRICRESLPEYQRQPDGQYVCSQAPDECGECLMAKERRLDAQVLITGDLEATRAAAKALMEENFVAAEQKFGDGE